MLLTKRSQYSIWMLVYLARQPGEKVAIEDIANAQGVSHTHMVKVSQNLSRHGYVRGFRGRGGGIALAMESEAIRIGDVVRDSEYTPVTFECDRSDCAKRHNCPLKKTLGSAYAGFLAALNEYTLADIAFPESKFKMPACIA